jgi:hypothetical protein
VVETTAAGHDEPHGQDMGAGRAHDEADRLRSEVDQLHEALASRDVIGQAKGILMERHGIGADEAFDRLVLISQTTNTKLSSVAAGIADRLGETEGGTVRPGAEDTTTVD